MVPPRTRAHVGRHVVRLKYDHKGHPPVEWPKDAKVGWEPRWQHLIASEPGEALIDDVILHGWFVTIAAFWSKV